MPLFYHASAALSTPPRRVRVHLQLPHVSLCSEDFRRLRPGPASWERLRVITACISSTKNENSFYVAAIVKPPYPFFFFPLFFSKSSGTWGICSPIKTSTSTSMSRYGHWSGTLSSQDSPCHLRGSTPDAPGHMASRRLAASCGVGTFVSNDLLSVRAPAPVTPYSLRLSTPVARPSGGDPT
jgi:hypothetical protein